MDLDFFLCRGLDSYRSFLNQERPAELGKVCVFIEQRFDENECDPLVDDVLLL